MDKHNDSILIVEDDRILLGSMARNLTAHGFHTQAAGSVAEAVATLRLCRPRLLLLDIDLPDGSGWEVVRVLRSFVGSMPNVIVISGLRPNPRLAREMECDAVLEKPFPMETLLRLVRAAVGDRSQLRSIPAGTRGI